MPNNTNYSIQHRQNHTPGKYQPVCRETELRNQIKLRESYIRLMLNFATGKRKLKHGKNANKRTEYQPEDYMRLGKSLCNIKRQINKLEYELTTLIG